MKTFKELIDNGADVNHADDLGITALMKSAKNGNLKMVKLLVANGARLNLLDNNNLSALYYATFSNNLDIVKYLVENGATINDNIYMTAIHKNYKDISLYFDSLDMVKQIIKES